MEGMKVCLILMVCLFTVQGDLCPNHKDRCPVSTTCCLLPDGTFGCCPYKNAMCCEDKIHCCPSGTMCNMKRQSCDSKVLGIPFQWMVPFYTSKLVALGLNTPTEVEEAVSKNIKCIDGNECPEKSTCCQMPSGSYGCCPYPTANCCSDREHCCPHNYNCDVKHNRCIIKKVSSANDFMISVLKEVPIYNTVKGVFEMPTPPTTCDTSAICDTARGEMCCIAEGGAFCCPQGTLCSEERGLCIQVQEQGTEALESKFLDTSSVFEQQPQEDTENVICPDKTDVCPENNTCCPMAGGQYGCCQYPEATCCSDKLHCCPNGYVCGSGFCEKKPFIRLMHLPVFSELSPLSPNV